MSRDMICPERSPFFRPESKLSGVEYKDFMATVWYKRDFTVPEAWEGKDPASLRGCGLRGGSMG